MLTLARSDPAHHDGWSGACTSKREYRIRDGESCLACRDGCPGVRGPQVSPGRGADPLRVLCPRSCCGVCWPVPCVLASVSCAGLAAQLASRVRASCEGEPGSVV